MEKREIVLKANLNKEYFSITDIFLSKAFERETFTNFSRISLKKLDKNEFSLVSEK